MDYQAIVARFDAVTEQPDGGYLARCPAHGDTRPSLRIWRGENGTVRMTCRAGCDTEHVVTSVGLQWSDLFNVTGEGPTVPSEKPRVVGVEHTAKLAVYVDATAAQLQSGERWAAKALEYAHARFGIDAETARELMLGVDAPGRSYVFPYRSESFKRYPRLTVPLHDFNHVPRGLQGRDLSGDCPGRWLSLKNPEGHRWGQYGVFRGAGGYGVIIVSEGPGDALTAVAVGYDAVAIRGASLAGSPELLAELADGLRGYQVIAAGDNDDAGQQFNRALAEGLKGHGIDVYALPIPDHGPKTDVTKWREANPAAFPDELHTAVKMARPVMDRAVAEAETRRAEVAQRVGTVVVSSGQGEEAARILEDLVSTYGDSDAMNAYALAAWCNGRIRYADGLGFYVWNGIIWEQSATKVRQEIHRMGAALVLAGVDSRVTQGFTMRRRIDDLMVELRAVPSVKVEPDAFDAQHHLLSFRNGVVDLRSGKLRDHSPDDMITVSLPVHYDPDATAPRWESFLREVFPNDPELPGYLQRLTGYGITGNTSEQCFAVLWGKGANGKSVYTETMTSIFGAITQTTGFATFEDKQSGGIPNDLAALRGARLVMASEGEAGRRMSESVLKRVTGKDRVTARFLRKEFFTFAPTFLIMLATNHKPSFRGQDEGLWRRVKLIPFTRYFAPEERDYDLDRKLLAETPGIVAWAVRGAVEWYARGLQDPDSITSATREYRATSDALAGFFPGVLVPEDGAQALGSDAFNAYLRWCDDENLPSKERWSRRAFFSAMEERGISKKKSNKGVTLVGVRIVADADSAAGPGIFGQ